MPKLKNTQEIKYVWLTIKINYFDLPAPVGVNYVATQFHASYSDGQMSKCVKTSQRCAWLIVTSRNVSSKINVKPSKVRIPISFLIIWIFWSNKNEFTLHIMTCLKTTESQNGQIYPEDTFSHGAAQMFSKGISRQQKSQLAGKEFCNNLHVSLKSSKIFVCQCQISLGFFTFKRCPIRKLVKTVNQTHCCNEKLRSPRMKLHC